MSSQMDDHAAYIPRPSDDGYENAYPYSSHHHPLAYAAFGVNPSMLNGYQGVPSSSSGSYISPYTSSQPTNLPYTADDLKQQPPYFLDHRSTPGYPTYVAGPGRGAVYLPQHLYYEQMYAASRRKEHLAAAALAAEEEAYYKAAFSEMVCLPDDDEDEATEGTVGLSEGASSTTVENSPKSEIDHEEGGAEARAVSAVPSDDVGVGTSDGQNTGERRVRDSHARSGVPLATQALLAAAHLVDNCSTVSTAGDSSVPSTPFSSGTDHDPNEAPSDAASPTETVLSEHDRTMREALRDPDNPSLAEPIASLVSQRPSGDLPLPSPEKTDDLSPPDQRASLPGGELTDNTISPNQRPLIPSRSPSPIRRPSHALSASSSPVISPVLEAVALPATNARRPSATTDEDKQAEDNTDDVEAPDAEHVEALDGDMSGSEDATLIQCETADASDLLKHEPYHRTDHEPPGDPEVVDEVQRCSTPSPLPVKEEPVSPIIVDPTLPMVINLRGTTPEALGVSAISFVHAPDVSPVTVAIDMPSESLGLSDSAVPAGNDAAPAHAEDGVREVGDAGPAAGPSSVVTDRETDLVYPQPTQPSTGLSPRPEERSATLPPSPGRVAEGARLSPVPVAEEGTDDDGDDMSISSEESADVPLSRLERVSVQEPLFATDTPEQPSENVLSETSPTKTRLPEEERPHPSREDDRSATLPPSPTRAAAAVYNGLANAESAQLAFLGDSSARLDDRSLKPDPSPTRAEEARAIDGDGRRYSPAISATSLPPPVSDVSSIPSSVTPAPSAECLPPLSVDTRMGSPVDAFRASPLSSSDTSRLSTLAEVAVYHLSPPLQSEASPQTRDGSMPTQVNEYAPPAIENTRSATSTPSLERAEEAAQSSSVLLPSLSDESEAAEPVPVVPVETVAEETRDASAEKVPRRSVTPSPTVERARNARTRFSTTSLSSLTESDDDDAQADAEVAAVPTTETMDEAPVPDEAAQPSGVEDSADDLDELPSVTALVYEDHFSMENPVVDAMVEPTSGQSSPLTALSSSQAESTRSFQALFNSSPSPVLEEPVEGGYFSDDDVSRLGSSPIKISPFKLAPSKIGSSKATSSKITPAKTTVAPVDKEPSTEPSAEPIVPAPVQDEVPADAKPKPPTRAAEPRMLADFVLVPPRSRKASATQNTSPAAAVPEDTAADAPDTADEPNTMPVPRYVPRSFEPIPPAPLISPFGPGRTRQKKDTAPPASPNPFLASSPSPSPVKKRRHGSSSPPTPRTRALKRMRVTSPIASPTASDDDVEAPEEFEQAHSVAPPPAHHEVTPPPVHPDITPPPVHPLTAAFLKPSSLKRAHPTPPSSSQRSQKRLRVAFADEEEAVVVLKTDYETRNELLPIESVTKVKKEPRDARFSVPFGEGSEAVDPIEVDDESSEDELGGWEAVEMRVVSKTPRRDSSPVVFDLREPAFRARRAAVEESDAEETEEESEEEVKPRRRGSRSTYAPASKQTRSATTTRRHSAPKRKQKTRYSR